MICLQDNNIFVPSGWTSGIQSNEMIGGITPGQEDGSNPRRYGQLGCQRLGIVYAMHRSYSDL